MDVLHELEGLVFEGDLQVVPIEELMTLRRQWPGPEDARTLRERVVSDLLDVGINWALNALGVFPAPALTLTPGADPENLDAYEPSDGFDLCRCSPIGKEYRLSVEMTTRTLGAVKAAIASDDPSHAHAIAERVMDRAEAAADRIYGRRAQVDELIGYSYGDWWMLFGYSTFREWTNSRDAATA
jgi:hypothetical protein